MGKIKDKKAYTQYKQMCAASKQKKTKEELYQAKEWYTIRALLGNQ